MKSENKARKQLNKKQRLAEEQDTELKILAGHATKLWIKQIGSLSKHAPTYLDSLKIVYMFISDPQKSLRI